MKLEDLKKLAGITGQSSPFSNTGSDTSTTAAEKRKIEREQNIRPGTDEWFQLWFRRPNEMGQMPTFRGRKK